MLVDTVYSNFTVNFSGTGRTERVAAEVSSVFGPYTRGPFSPTACSRRGRGSSRRSASTRCNADVHKRIIILKNVALPTAKSTSNIILDGQIIFQKSDTDIRHHILDLLATQFPNTCIDQNTMNLVRCEGRRITRPTLPSTFTWSGEFISKFVGQGALYVQVS